MELTDEQWTILGPLIPEPPRREDGKGRPRRQPREVLEGICGVLRTGAQWADLICLSDTRRIRLVTDAFKNGLTKGC